MAEYRSVTAEAILQGLALQTDAQIGGQAVRAAAELLTKVDLPGGLEYEAGIWSTEEETKNGVVRFSKTHAKRPFLFVISSQPQGEAFEFMTCYHAAIFSFYDLLGYGVPRRPEQESDPTEYGFMTVWACTTYSLGMSATHYDLTTDPNAPGSPPYDSIKAYLKTDRVNLPNGTNKYSTAPWDWTPNVQYKWIAVWAPETKE